MKFSTDFITNHLRLIRWALTWTRIRHKSFLGNWSETALQGIWTTLHDSHSRTQVAEWLAVGSYEQWTVVRIFWGALVFCQSQRVLWNCSRIHCVPCCSHTQSLVMWKIVYLNHFPTFSASMALWTRVGPKRPRFSTSMGSITLPKVFPRLQLFQERPHTGRVAVGLCQKISDHDHLRSDHDHLSREADRSRSFARGNKWSAKVRASFHNPTFHPPSI